MNVAEHNKLKLKKLKEFLNKQNKKETEATTDEFKKVVGKESMKKINKIKEALK